MKLERLTDLREHSFSSPDFQVGVRNDTDGGKLGGKLSVSYHVTAVTTTHQTVNNHH